MPRVPTYDRARVLGGRPMSGMDSRDIAAYAYASGGALAETGQQIMKVAEIASSAEVQRQKDDAMIEFSRKRSSFESQLAETTTRLQETDGANIRKYQDPSFGSTSHPDTYFNQSLKAFDNLSQKDEWKTTNRYTQQMWDRYIVDKKADVNISALAFESKQRVEAREISIGDAFQDDIRSVTANPAKLTEIITRNRGLLDNLDDPKTKEIEGYNGVVRPRFIAAMRDKIGELTESAYQTMITDNPVAAYRSLQAMGKNEQAMKFHGLNSDQYSRLLRTAKNQAEATSAVAVYQLERRLEDHVASIASTGKGLPGFNTRESVVAAVMAVADPLGEGKKNERAVVMADKAWREINIAQKTYNIAAEMKWLPENEIGAKFNELRPSGAGAADETKIQAGVQQTLNSWIQQRKTDPGGFWQTHPTVTSKMNEGDVAGARETMIALQLRAGIPTYQIALLSDGQRAAEINHLKGASTATMVQTMQSLKERYGGKDGKYKGQYDLIWRQLTTGPNALPPEFMFAARVMGTPTETKVIQALRADPKVLKESLGTLTSTGQSLADMEAQAASIGQQYHRALTGGMPERLTQYNGLLTIATKMAALDVVNSGGSVKSQDALKRAFKDVMSSFDISGGTYFIPLSKPGEMNTYNIQNIHANAEIIKASPKLLAQRFRLTVPGSRDPGLNQQPAWMNEQYLTTLSKDAYWATNDQGTGLMLMLNTSSGAIPVPTSDGGIAEISFSDLSQTPDRGANRPSAGRSFGGSPFGFR